MNKLSPEWQGMIAAFTANTIYGLSFMFSKIAYEKADISVVLADRFILAVIAMLLLSRTRWSFAKLHLRNQPWKKMLALCLCEPIIYFLCESQGIVRTSSSFSAVMIALIPICSLAVAAIFLKEKPRRVQVVYSVISIIGVIVISLVGASLGVVTVLGFLFLLGAIISAAGYTVISRSMINQSSAYERTFCVAVSGALWFTLSAMFENHWQVSVLITPFADWAYTGSILFLAVICSVGAYALSNLALNTLTVARMTMFANWTTIVSIIAGVVFLNERFTWVQVLGSVLILIGLYGVNHFTEAKSKPKQQHAA